MNFVRVYLTNGHTIDLPIVNVDPAEIAVQCANRGFWLGGTYYPYQSVFKTELIFKEQADD